MAKGLHSRRKRRHTPNLPDRKDRAVDFECGPQASGLSFTHGNLPGPSNSPAFKKLGWAGATGLSNTNRKAPTGTQLVHPSRRLAGRSAWVIVDKRRFESDSVARPMPEWSKGKYNPRFENSSASRFVRAEGRWVTAQTRGGRGFESHPVVRPVVQSGQNA